MPAEGALPVVRWLAAALPLLAVGCASASPDSVDSPSGVARCACATLDLPGEPVVDEPGLLALLDTVRTSLYPEQADLTIGAELVTDLQFFRAWTELDTVGAPPRERRYVIQVDPTVLADPPTPAALAAVLAHELGHVDHYVTLDTDAFVAFAAWYAGEDPLTSAGLADYERETDEKSLARGCAEGLTTMREWIYDHCEGDVEAAKRFQYYSPEEIAAWEEANGSCR